MLTHPTIEQLDRLRLSGMAQALREQLTMPDLDEMTFEERLALLVEREAAERSSRLLNRRLKQASLRQMAAIADIDCHKGRGLSKRTILELAGCSWVRSRQNLLITGATGVGKSYVACALAHAACLEGHTALYRRLSRLLEEIQLSRGDGRYLRLLKLLSRTDVLVLDDWGLTRLGTAQQSDLLELLDDRYRQRSTIITSQLPIDHWHEAMTDPTLADAILDRLVHDAHQINLKGESMRKRTSNLHTDNAMST